MDGIDGKKVLWDNISALMEHHWQGENLTRLAREADIGPGTATRIKKQKTSVGIDVVERLSRLFGLEPWQLLVPGFDAFNPPVLMPMSQRERDFYNRVLAAHRDLTSK
jgi:hypothetical protein